ncbi:MAG: hypothetical protein CSA24_00225 [Deltaproteobacteria bacterium]|nr:MAG: hypothetical protein CSA24_00225 [Deltaproteobacteria bacterium]
MRPDPHEPLELDDDELEPIPDGQPSPYQATQVTQSLQSVDLCEVSDASLGALPPGGVRAGGAAAGGGVGGSSAGAPRQTGSMTGLRRAAGMRAPSGAGPIRPEPTGEMGVEHGPMTAPTLHGRRERSSVPTGAPQPSIADMRRNPTPSRRTGPPRPAHVPPAEPPPRRSSRRRKRKEPKIDSNLGRVLGSYRILSLIGAGGMGQVYMAEHTMLGRKVALKLLRSEYAVKRDAVHRFFQEARAVNAIGHENIVDITDYVELDSGETFFIMELLEGQDLSDYLRASDKPMPLHQAMQIALQVCEALNAAHAKSIIHRDLKPDNIFIVNTATKRWFVKLLDFGVAKLQGDASADASYQTAAGSVIGTPAYMSPEQASGLPIDNRTDIYSLGAILYEMFTGHPVFRAKSFGEFVVKHMNDQPVPPRDLADAPKIPMALEAVILRCLEKDPDKRYQNVEQLREDLARATATVETVVQAVPPKKTKRKRSNLLLVPIGVGVLGLAVGAFLWASGIVGGDSPRKPRSAPTTGSATGQSKTGVTASPLPRGEGVQAKTVLLKLSSKPKGASVYELAGGKERLIGKTPYRYRVERPKDLKATITLLFRLEGHKDETKTVQLSDQHVEALLALDDPDPIDGPAGDAITIDKKRERRRHHRRRPKRRKHRKVEVAPAVVDPDKQLKAAPKVTKPTKKKGKTKTINKTDQVDPFAQ